MVTQSPSYIVPTPKTGDVNRYLQCFFGVGWALAGEQTFEPSHPAHVQSFDNLHLTSGYNLSPAIGFDAAGARRCNVVVVLVHLLYRRSQANADEQRVRTFRMFPASVEALLYILSLEPAGRDDF